MHLQIQNTALSKGEIYTKMCTEAEKGSYTSYLRGKRCKTEDLFFNEVSASFQFPYYFGENWAAMDECLCDLEWLSISKIFVVIEDFSCMFSDQAHIQDVLKNRVIKYFSIMADYWKSEGITVEVWLNH
jgi:RNAse (barnase) inhibitor barstar